MAYFCDERFQNDTLIAENRGQIICHDQSYRSRKSDSLSPMGGNAYSCFSSSCTRDSSHEFSEVLSISNEEDYQGSALNSHECHAHSSVSSPHPATLLKSRNIEESKSSAGDQPPSTASDTFIVPTKVPSEDAHDYADSGHESPDDRSQESVMTAISPTKERRGPLLSPKR